MSKKTNQSKTFSLTKQELTLLQYQADLKAQYEYLASLISRDSFIFLNREVRQRLGVASEMQLSLDLEKGKVTATPPPQPEPESKQK